MRAFYENRVVLLQMEQVRDESLARRRWFHPGYFEVCSVIRIRPGYHDQTHIFLSLMLKNSLSVPRRGYQAPKVLTATR